MRAIPELPECDCGAIVRLPDGRRKDRGFHHRTGCARIEEWKRRRNLCLAFHRGDLHPETFAHELGDWPKTTGWNIPVALTLYRRWVDERIVEAYSSGWLKARHQVTGDFSDGASIAESMNLAEDFLRDDAFSWERLAEEDGRHREESST